MPDITVAADRPRPPAEERDRHPLRDVLDRMERARDHISKADPQLSETIRLLAERADRPGMLDHPTYRGRVAYALLDLEKLAGPVGNMPEPLRHEMKRLATSVTGLQNERLQDLMRRTAEIADGGLVRDIRVIATDTAQRPSQDTSAIRDRVEALENRARLTKESPTLTAGLNALSEQPSSTGVLQGPQQPKSAASLPEGKAITEHPSYTRPMPVETPAGPAQDVPTPQGSVLVRGPGLVASIVSAIYQANQQKVSQTALDPTPTPMAERVSRFEQQLQVGREENAFRGAEQSGRAALEAMHSFANGPGAGVMNRIREAAKADPAGMAGVMAEMRAGGVYADLRAQFAGAMQKEKGFAAAYDRAASATGQYAKDRTAVDAIVAQRPDVDALTGRFQKLDAQIGEAAGNTPGRKEGKSALEDLAAKAAEIMSRAVEKLRSMFSNAPRTDSSPSPAP